VSEDESTPSTFHAHRIAKAGTPRTAVPSIEPLCCQVSDGWQPNRQERQFPGGMEIGGEYRSSYDDAGNRRDAQRLVDEVVRIDVPGARITNVKSQARRAGF
jgi:hypothetical protein